MCERLFKYGHESCCGQNPLSGGLAEACLLAPGTAIIRVPNTIPDAVASSANCAIATVAGAVRVAGGCAGKHVFIQGAGLLGLTTAAMSQVAGAASILVADVDPHRLATARGFGATHTINVQPAADQLRPLVDQLTAGRGVDVAFEVSGAPDAVPLGLAQLRTGGCYVLVGAVKPVGAISLNVEQVVRSMWRIEGLHNYAPQDLATAIDFLAEHHARFPFAAQVAGEFALDQVDAAFQQMIDTKAIRVAVRPFA
jgi:threonine dehydrogenase-like Zn-dependent dehydrogenase